MVSEDERIGKKEVILNRVISCIHLAKTKYFRRIGKKYWQQNPSLH